MKKAPHERMHPDEVEYAERGGRAYAVCSQQQTADVTSLQAAFWAGFKSACAYLRAPGIDRSAIIDDVPLKAPRSIPNG